MKRTLTIAGLALLGCVFASLAEAAQPAPFGIHVVDDVTGRGVPLVTFKTTNSIELVSDSNGWIAFDEPGMLGQKVWFEISSPGYEYPKNGFGFRGVGLSTQPGGETTVKIHRTQIAQRIYRLTGQGIYADSVRLGQPVPLDQPVLNAQVAGQDSTNTAVYQGKMYWFWGDTGRIGAPLGNFRMTGATSLLPGEGGLDPSVGVNLKYFTGKDGFVRSMFTLKEPGLVWSGSPMVVDMPDGKKGLVCVFTRLKDMSHLLARGIAVWNDKTEQFDARVEVPLKSRLFPSGLNPLRYTDHGVEYYCFNAPYPLMRVRADWNHVSNLESYEAYTPLVAGTDYEGDKSRIERDAHGRIVYGWKANTAAVDEVRQLELIKAGLIKPDEAWINLRDDQTDKPVRLHAGTVRWNAFRKKWIMIGVEAQGLAEAPPEMMKDMKAMDKYLRDQIDSGKIDSVLGDIWYVESDSLLGPWRHPVRVAVHPRYSYYHPSQHVEFDQDGGRIIYFEGTYTATFSTNENPTPRYDYNQLVYKLDLSDPRLHKQP